MWSKRTRVLAIAAMTFAMGAGNAAGESRYEGVANDAWISGKIEMVYLLNSQLSPFEIQTEVDDGRVTLSGVVESEIASSLAEEIASDIEGVTEVDNQLEIAMDARRRDPSGSDGSRDFGTWVDDATTTAAVKTRLMGNEHIRALEIDVDTSNDIVMLSGRVNTVEERQLAERIAMNAKDVEEVRNYLAVDPQ